MPNGELPKRAAYVGPPRAVHCGAPGEVIARYIVALRAHDWATGRLGGGVSSTPTSDVTNESEGTR
ncbi:hypothetical protein ACQP1G_03400 [Nocardia sp. CA-107356]|uniref:hypothetical protein n=1 Tax=Nocardia sp. CA-107356 TaxID=3239972 RepID=UPI003D8B1EFF